MSAKYTIIIEKGGLHEDYVHQIFRAPCQDKIAFSTTSLDSPRIIGIQGHILSQ